MKRREYITSETLVIPFMSDSPYMQKLGSTETEDDPMAKEMDFEDFDFHFNDVWNESE